MFSSFDSTIFFKIDVLIFERSREIDRKKKSTNLVLNPCHDKTNSNPARSVPYLLALTKQQKENCVIIWIIKLATNTTLWWLHRLAKQRFLLFFAQQKISKRYPEFFAYVISQKWSTNPQKQLRNDAFHVKTSQSAKN